MEGTLPPNLLELWDLKEAAQRISPAERIEQLRNIAMSCDELDSHCEGAACRHLAKDLSKYRSNRRSCNGWRFRELFL